MYSHSKLLHACALLAPCSAALAGDAPPPLFGDWWYLMPEDWRSEMLRWDSSDCQEIESLRYDQTNQYLPVNQPGGGHGGPTYGEGEWMSDFAICVAKEMERYGAPVSLILRSRNCPYPYDLHEGQEVSPDALPDALDALPRLDYLLMDLEAWGPGDEAMVQMNVDEIVRMIREHPNPNIRNAYIGNYDDYPGDTDPGTIWPNRRTRTNYRSTGWNREAFYHEYMNVAMPIAYPCEIFSRHSDEAIQGPEYSPNDRAAIFWAPLERTSIAARHLPEGHLLIPWVSNFVESYASPTFYHAPPPPEEDLRALIQHIRLRGAHSFIVWTSDKGQTVHPFIDYEQYRALALDAWGELDPLFDSSETVEFLNMQTSKKSGLNWSGVRIGSDVHILVSNLDENRDLALGLPAIDGLPATTPPVPAGTHAWFTYSVDPAARDFDGDNDVDTNDFIAFVYDFMSPSGAAENTAGGKGARSADVDTNGVLDLRDAISVAMAMRSGKFRPAARSTNFSRSGSGQTSSKRHPTSSAGVR